MVLRLPAAPIVTITVYINAVCESPEDYSLSILAVLEFAETSKCTV